MGNNAEFAVVIHPVLGYIVCLGMFTLQYIVFIHPVLGYILHSLLRYFNTLIFIYPVLGYIVYLGMFTLYLVFIHPDIGYRYIVCLDLLTLWFSSIQFLVIYYSI